MKSNSTGRSIAREVGHEHERALEDADEQRRSVDIVGGDLLAEIVHALLHLVLVDDHAADVRVVHAEVLAVFAGVGTGSVVIQRKRRVCVVTFTRSSIR